MSLRSLSDSQILSRIQDLIRRERELTLAVLLHLNEIERRRLHLKLGYSSLFEYCTAKLGYSASAAGRRIQTARCIARFPGVYALLQANEVNLSTVSMVSRILNDVNQDELLSRIRGKSQREVEAIVAEYEPRAMPRDLVRTIAVSPAPALLESRCAAGTEGPSGVDRTAEETQGSCSAENTLVKKERTPAAGVASPEVRTMLQFAVRKEFMVKLERLRSLLWHRLPADASLEQVFELALDLALEKKDPAKRIERREKRAKRDGRGRGSVRLRRHGRKATRGISQPPCATRSSNATADDAHS